MHKNEFAATVQRLVLLTVQKHEIAGAPIDEDTARTLLAMVFRNEFLSIVNATANGGNNLPEDTVLPEVEKKVRPAKKTAEATLPTVPTEESKTAETQAV